MVDLRTVIAIHCCRRVIQRCQQISLDVVDLRNVLVDTVKNILQVVGIDL